jgi:ubiquinone/menaquinone biosynthesis C-methylase UbiE
MTDRMFHPRGPTFWELAEQALSSTERGYDLLAPKFDYTPFRTPDFVLEPAMERVAKAGLIDSALDICCGTGAAMQHLRTHCRRRLVGIDMSRGMLDVARANLAGDVGRSNAPPYLEFVLGDALDMPFENDFDLAVCFGAHGHILPKDEPRFVNQIARVLRPGGRFAFVSGYMPPLWSPRFWLARAFNAAMRVRNVLFQPPFIMYYLTFMLPRAAQLLKRGGFDVTIDDTCFTGRLSPLKLVVATKR